MPDVDAFLSIIKRNGDVVAFDRAKIVTAIYKAGAAVGTHDMPLAQQRAQEIVDLLLQVGGTPSVEEIQDMVEEKLIQHRHSRIAKSYILYRDDRARLRLSRQKRPGKTETTPWKTMWQTLLWNGDHRCGTIAELNEHVRNNTFRQLILAALVQ